MHHPSAFGYSASLPSNRQQSNYSSSNYQQLPGRNMPTVRYPPSAMPNGNASHYGRPTVVRPQQEATVLRPVELPMPRDEMSLRQREEQSGRSTTTFGVMAPTAFTQVRFEWSIIQSISVDCHQLLEIKALVALHCDSNIKRFRPSRLVELTRLE